MEKQFYTLHEALKITGFGEKTLKVLMKQKLLPFAKVGNRYVFHDWDFSQLHMRMTGKHLNLERNTLTDINLDEL